MSSNTSKPFGSATEFAVFGKRTFAYMRPVKSDDMNATFPNDVDLPTGLALWGLFDAAGEPIALADEPAALVENAAEMDLMTLARH